MNPPKRNIVVPVSEVEFRDFKIEAINKGTTVPKLAREKLFLDAKEAPNAASKWASHTLTRGEPLERKLDR